MQLFIDTNSFLSFYHFSSDDLEELRKLRVLLDRGELKLLLPNQVVDEFHRNRDGKISDALKNFAAHRLNVQFPQLAKDYEEYRQLRQLQNAHEKVHTKLMARLKEDAANHDFKADFIIRELFEASTHLPITPEIINGARHRLIVGNPPGKKESHGDAINWEALLAHGAPDDLYFVSEDNDYSSPVDEGSFNSFLANEWDVRNNSEVFLYKRLSQFFGEKFPQIKLATELEKELLIKALKTTDSFRQTTGIINELTRFSDLSAAQANDLVAAAISNSYVHGMVRDLHVRAFLGSLILAHQNEIEPSNLTKLEVLLGADDAAGPN